jgi:hypothetical protein
MVKRDLIRIDIPYRNDDGIPGLHSADRHTYITGLLKNGVSIVEAKELARHSNVKMTMKYTHIGIKDQHRALQNFPWEDIGRTPRASEHIGIAGKNRELVRV